jgi:hypothetical protein
MLVAEVHGQESAADVGLNARGNRLGLPRCTMREAAAGKGGQATQLAWSRGVCPCVTGYHHPCVIGHEQGLHQSVRNWLVFVA